MTVTNGAGDPAAATWPGTPPARAPLGADLASSYSATSFSATGHAPDAPRADPRCPADWAGEDDLELLRLVRAGHDAAFAELFSRHAAAVRGFALRCAADVAEAEDMAAEAFFRVLQAVRRGSGPDGNVRAYLITVVRRLAAEWGTRRRDVPVADEDLSRQLDAGRVEAVATADLQLITRAFSSLPQRWRAVLWRVEVQGERPAVVARHFGLSPNATAALARRARQGLRAAYLQAHLAPAGSGGIPGCRATVDKLGAFTADQVTGAEARRIGAHLAGCPPCRALHAELADVCAGLRRYAGALTPPLLGAATAGHPLAAKSGALAAKSGAAAGRFAGRFAALGARVKLGLAAVSVAAVGGLGVVAVPLAGHEAPSIIADRGDGGVGTPLLGLASSGAAGSDVAPQDPAVRFRPTGRTGSPAAVRPTAGPARDRGASAPPAPGAQQADTAAPPPSQASSAQAGPQPQQAAAPVSTTPDPATMTGSPTRRTAAPVQPPPSTQQQQSTTVWTTSWTTDDTTVWMTVWSVAGH